MMWLKFEFFIKEAINRVEWRKSIHALDAKSEIKAFLLFLLLLLLLLLNNTSQLTFITRNLYTKKMVHVLKNKRHLYKFLKWENNYTVKLFYLCYLMVPYLRLNAFLVETNSNHGFSTCICIWGNIVLTIYIAITFSILNYAYYWNLYQQTWNTMTYNKH